MGNFDQAVQFVLDNEKGLELNANDPGGATNFGISLRFLRDIPGDRMRKYGIFYSDLTVETIATLTVDQAKLIYKGEFWDKAPFDGLQDQSICNYVFDMAVLHGEVQAIKILQRAVWALKNQKDIIHDDGILGDVTLVVVNSCISFNLLCCLMSERAGFCRLLTVENPKEGVFLDGWLNRCYRI